MHEGLHSLWPYLQHPQPVVSNDTAEVTTYGVLPHTPVNHTVFKLPVSCCNFTLMFFTWNSWASSTLTFVWPFWTFKLAHSQAALWTPLRNCLYHLVTFLYQDVLHIKISNKFDVDLCVTFLNFQTSSHSSCLVNTITTQELHASCNFTGIFSTLKSWTSLMLTFLTFWTRSSNGICRNLLWMWYRNSWICMHHVVTLQGCSPHNILRIVWCWSLCDLFDLSSYPLCQSVLFLNGTS